MTGKKEPMREQTKDGLVMAATFAFITIMFYGCYDSLTNTYINSYRDENQHLRRALDGWKQWEKIAIEECKSWERGGPPP